MSHETIKIKAGGEMISFETVQAITEWWKANAKGRRVSVLLRGQRREINMMKNGVVVLGFPLTPWVTPLGGLKLKVAR